MLLLLILLVHRDAYLRTTLDPATVVAAVALGAAWLATLRFESLNRAAIVLRIVSAIVALYAMEASFL